MKKNKSYIYIFLILIICISISVFAFVKFSPTPGVGDIPYTWSRGINQNVSTSDTVTLIAQNKTYTIQIKNGNTVYDAMNTLENTKGSNFTFHTKEYSGLGNFIDDINGSKGTPGNYWIYYVNNKEAPIGISKYVLKSGDVISWEQGAF
ncbi:MAG TPA: DUF4430 domain-containing protein [Candidatus Paceibacterota bacterium]|nr:DUF4430 domain-containing protein [Candidatus Paceibacterota bacterium]